MEPEVSVDSVSELPEEVRSRLKELGITRLRWFQYEAIKRGMRGRSLVIVAPTGAGKTLVGELLALSVVKNGGKVLMLVPYKALAEEHRSTFQRRWPWIRTEVGTGDYKEKPTRLLGADADVLICTYEKCDMILRERPWWLSQVRLVIVDEVHLVGDPDRGPLLDAILTRLKRLGVQLVALSATIPNADELAEWLEAELVKSDWRPVKLLEGVYCMSRGKIYFYDPRPEEKEFLTVRKGPATSPASLDAFLKPESLASVLGEGVEIVEVREEPAELVERTYERDELSEQLERAFCVNGAIVCDRVERLGRERSFMDAVLNLTYDLFEKMKRYDVRWQILIFRRSRALAQKTAQKIAEMMKTKGLYVLFPRAREAVEELRRKVSEETPLTELLAECMKWGVAFHHAGLTRAEREVVERAFRERKIGVVVCTPTLAAGVNLPARRVVIELSKFGGSRGRISVAEFKQRGGRAGRPGLDVVGEAIIVARDEREMFELFERYIFAKPERVEATLGLNVSRLREQVLAQVVCGGRQKVRELIDFFASTFYAWQKSRTAAFLVDELCGAVRRCLVELAMWGFCRLLTEDGSQLAVTELCDEEHTYVEPTKLGERVAYLYLDPLSAHAMLESIDVWKRRGAVAPAEFFKAVSRTAEVSQVLPKLAKPDAVASVLRLLPDEVRAELEQAMRQEMEILSSALRYGGPATMEEELSVASLGLAAVMECWINEVPLKQLLEPFSPSFGGGDMVELVRICEWLAYCARELAAAVRAPLRVVAQLDTLRRRIAEGVKEDLLELVRVPGIGRVRARTLKQYGYDSLEKIAKATPEELQRVPGIGPKLAERLIEFARRYVARMR